MDGASEHHEITEGIHYFGSRNSLRFSRCPSMAVLTYLFTIWRVLAHRWKGREKEGCLKFSPDLGAI